MEILLIVGAAVAGFIAGALVFRNNAKRFAELEQKLRDAKDQLK